MKDYFDKTYFENAAAALPPEWFAFKPVIGVILGSGWGQALLDEPYVDEKALGNCNIVFPYQVPESQWFVMGDHRKTSSDSRNTAIGCVSLDRVVGVVLFRVWPFEGVGPLR